MNYRVDVASEYQKIKSKMLRSSLLFSLALAIVIISDVLLVVLAKEDYIINLIIAIVITVIFSCFTIFYFTNIYYEMNMEYRYYKGYEGGIKSTDEVMVIKSSEELTYLNGLYVYPVLVKYIDNLSSQEKIVYSLNKELGYQEGDKLTITTYQRILIEAEKHS